MPLHALEQILSPYKFRVEQQLKSRVEALGPKNTLRDACEYALLIGGKRLRPAIVWMIAESLGKEIDVTHPALCVEYLHTASLIADDLPCMDNDDERRNRPSTHKAFNETIALLASYALISAGYEALYLGAQEMKKSSRAQLADQAVALALENVSRNTGIHGVTGGQFLDLYPPNHTLETLLEAIHLKTSALFETSFVLGWLYGGGDTEKLSEVRLASAHLGLIFQLVDDFFDMEQDKKVEHSINAALILGPEKAIELLDQETRAFEAVLQHLKLAESPLLSIVKLLVQAAKEISRLLVNREI